MRSGTDIEREQAKKILPIISRHHFLLCTLMLFNASANEALPIFLDELVPTWLSIVLAVVLVLLCGEIIPAAIFTGPHQIKLAATLSPLVIMLLVLFSPIAYPLALLLDALLGHGEGVTVYNRYEIAAMMQIQHEESQKRADEGAGNTNIQHDEVAIIDGALKFRDIQVHRVMTPVERVFALPIDGRLDFQTMADIFKSGFSRIPIYGAGGLNDICGLLLVKDLIFIDPDDQTPLANFLHVFGRPVQTVWADTPLHEALKMFRQGKGHLAIVQDVKQMPFRDPFYATRGIITLEDIIGEILGEDIADETDHVSRENRDIDFARLITLIGPQGIEDDKKVKLNEAKVIANHLLTTVPQMRELMGPSAGQNTDSRRVIDFVMSCPVFTVDRAAAEPEYLFRRGKVASACILILHGQVSCHPAPSPLDALSLALLVR